MTYKSVNWRAQTKTAQKLYSSERHIPIRLISGSSHGLFLKPSSSHPSSKRLESRREVEPAPPPFKVLFACLLFDRSQLTRKNFANWNDRNYTSFLPSHELEVTFEQTNTCKLPTLFIFPPTIQRYHNWHLYFKYFEFGFYFILSYLFIYDVKYMK